MTADKVNSFDMSYLANYYQPVSSGIPDSVNVPIFSFDNSNNPILKQNMPVFSAQIPDFNTVFNYTSTPQNDFFNFSMSNINIDFSQFSMNNFNNNSNLSEVVEKLYNDFTTSLNASYKNQINQLMTLFKIPAGNVTTGNQKNDEKIAKLDPQMQIKVKDLLEYAKSKGLNVTITSGYRTQAQQEELLRTRPEYAAKDSLHCKGKAIDISIANGTDSDYKLLADYAKSIGMRWGGDFSKVKERWHFDMGLA